MAWYGSSENMMALGRQQAGFRPQLGMGGTRIPAPNVPQTPQGIVAHKAFMANQAQAQGPQGRPPTDRFGYGGAAGMTHPNGSLAQAATGPDAGGVNPGLRQMPPPPEMGQAERDQMGANFGPRNAALAGYMMG